MGFLARICLLVLVHETLGKTCPGFPGYCSESFPGQTCVVVCSRGRNNVPLCQEDGTWTDIPRCIEHEPGVEEQIPGLCPGISGYCSEGFLGQRCQFKCSLGGNIDSVCTVDGTWSPYPRCLGDIRESQDGCNPCPGPLGGRRNRTLEAIYRLNNEARMERLNEDKRRLVPTFSGSMRIGPLASKEQGVLFRSNPVQTTRATPPRTTTALPSTTTSFRIFSHPPEVPPTAVEEGNFFSPPFQRNNGPPGPQKSDDNVQPIFRNLKNKFSGKAASKETKLQETKFIFKNGKIVPVNGDNEPSPPLGSDPLSSPPPPLFVEVSSQPRSLQQFGSFGPFQIFDPNAQGRGELKIHEAVPKSPPAPGSNFGPFQTLIL